MKRIIAGVDEVGRGPLAGPVVAAAVSFYQGYQNERIKDSKKLSKRQREQLIATIKADALAWSIIAVGPRRIEQLNIREASRLAMSLAVQRIQADLVLVDGNVPIWTALPQRTVISGDSLHVEISAASILAKVWRDDLMAVLDKKYPGYAMDRHAGYPTSEHRQAISKLGPCRVHRRTFAGVREYVDFEPRSTGGGGDFEIITAQTGSAG
ncbi:MAG: ribonuclease HII [Oligoflexia bacterium]|nr:ribonuclease HII [Oligoflexia bacterium]